jgi:hypothetical protein
MFPPMIIAYVSLSHIHLFTQEHFTSTGSFQQRKMLFGQTVASRKYQSMIHLQQLLAM